MIFLSCHRVGLFEKRKKEKKLWYLISDLTLKLTGEMWAEGWWNESTQHRSWWDICQTVLCKLCPDDGKNNLKHKCWLLACHYYLIQPRHSVLIWFMFQNVKWKCADWALFPVCTCSLCNTWKSPHWLLFTGWGGLMRTAFSSIFRMSDRVWEWVCVAVSVIPPLVLGCPH